MLVLGIESSCDETAAAVISSCDDGGNITPVVLSNVVASQINEHRLYGGVVPEIASRRHCENISVVTAETLEKAKITMNQIDIIAVTAAPGLLGALLVGVTFAKGLARAYSKPLIPVHHIRGHIAACYLSGAKPPFLCLVCSGGHSHIVKVNDYTDFKIIGRTTDDAAGECFDKTARAMGLPYPGGREIERVAARYIANMTSVNTSTTPTATAASIATAPELQTAQIIQSAMKKYKLPLPQTEKPYDYSFSGLKTSVINIIHNAEQKRAADTTSPLSPPIDIPALACSFQYTTARYLTKKFIAAAEHCAAEDKNAVISLGFAGGVAANGCIRKTIAAAAKERGFPLYIPEPQYCGDNAAMIALQGLYEYKARGDDVKILQRYVGNTGTDNFDAHATMSIEAEFER